MCCWDLVGLHNPCRRRPPVWGAGLVASRAARWNRGTVCSGEDRGGGGAMQAGAGAGASPCPWQRRRVRVGAAASMPCRWRRCCVGGERQISEGAGGGRRFSEGAAAGVESMQGAGAATSTACRRARCKDGALHRAGARDAGGGELRHRQRWDLRGTRRGSVARDGGARGAPTGGRGAGD